MTESWICRPAQPKLYCATFKPRGRARGTVLIVPGFSEHVGRFREAADTWARAGLLVAVFDPRGQGRSEGLRGHVDRFDEHVMDTLAVLDTLERVPEWRDSGTPILFGHSLGGLIAVETVVRAATRLRALALSSPYFGLALPAPRWKLALARAISGFWPTYRDRTGIRSTQLTHDPEQQRLIDHDPLNVPTVTARWFTEVERAQARVLDDAPRIRLPIFCAAAGEDTIASLQHTRRIFEAFGSKEKSLQVYPEAFHELHHELRRDAYLRAFAEQFMRWTDPQLGLFQRAGVLG